MRRWSSPIPSTESPLHRPLRLAFGQRLALVVLALAAAEGELQLGSAGAQVHTGWNQGETLLTRGLLQFQQFAPVQQQAAGTAGIVIHAGRRLVWGDVGVDQPGLPAFDSDVGLLQADLARSHRFDLRALQGQPGLEMFTEEVVAAGCPIAGDDLDSSVLHGVSRGLSRWPFPPRLEEE